MIWLIALLAIVLPEERGGLADTVFLSVAGAWFVFRVGMLAWQKVRGQGADAPHVTWTAFSLVVLFFSALCTYGSICQYLSFTAFRILVANVLLFVVITEVGRRNAVGSMLAIAVVGMAGTLLPLSPWHRSVGRLIFMLPYGANLLEGLLERSGMITFAFVPPMVFALLIGIGDLGTWLAEHKPDATEVKKRRLQFVYRALSGAGFALVLLLWLVFVFAVAWGNPRGTTLLMLPAACFAFGVAQIGKRRSIARRSVLLAVTIVLSVFIANYSRTGVIENLVLKAFQRNPGLPLNLQMADPSFVRACVESLPGGTGLGTLEGILPQYRSIGEWRVAWGGSYQVVQAELGWTWLAIGCLLLSAGLASFVEKCVKARTHAPDWRLIFLGSLLISLLATGIVDVRVHLLLCPLLWITLGSLVAWAPADRDESNKNSPRTFGGLRLNRNLVVVIQSFLLSLLLLVLVVNLYRSVRSKAGVLHFNRAVKLATDPNSARAAILKELVEASEWSPTDSRIDYEIARTFLRSYRNPPSSPGAQERQNARLALDQAIAKCPMRSDYRGLLGQVLFLEGDTAGALEMYRSAVQTDPLNAFWRRSLADLYETMGNLSEAERHLRVLCDLLPFSGEARYNLARVMERQGWKGDALEIHQAASEVQPGFIPTFGQEQPVQEP